VCQCASGYTGSRCQTIVDACSSSPCVNNGTCLNAVASYTCVCPAGYTGPYCEDPFSACSSNPCANGGTCGKIANGFECLCADGFTGALCQTPVDGCASSPCENGATCLNGIGSYVCECPDGFNGTTCGTNGSALSTSFRIAEFSGASLSTVVTVVGVAIMVVFAIGCWGCRRRSMKRRQQSLNEMGPLGTSSSPPPTVHMPVGSDAKADHAVAVVQVRVEPPQPPESKYADVLTPSGGR